MTNEAEDKALFRMNNIVPKGLASATTFRNDQESVSSYSAEEVEIQMTWGKIAGAVSA